MSTPTTVIRWGILGTGNIAAKFAAAVSKLPDACLTAVGSRRADSAAAFAAKHSIGTAHSSYEALANDAAVDAVYVATPHPFHLANTLLCLESGKAVLCEKPLAINAAQVATMIAAAQQRQLFLMEAMWTRFLPALEQVRVWLQEERIGEVRQLSCDFGFRADINPAGRLFNTQLGGGALLDVGVYTVAFAYLVFGQRPAAVLSSAHLGETGVDEQSATILRYANGALAVLTSAIRTTTAHLAHIDGTTGRITIPNFWRGTTATLEVAGEASQSIDKPFEINGFEYEIREVMHCLRNRKTESAKMPLSESLAIANTMDQIRAQWPLRYPDE